MAAPTGNQNNNKYRPENAKHVYKLCLLGARDKDLADFFDVHRDTIFYWAKLYPEFAEARKRGKLAVDAEVAYSLFNRAMGVTVTKQKVLSSGEIVKYKEELPPDVRAMSFWLKCRSRGNWNPGHQLELSGENSNPLAFILADIAKDRGYFPTSVNCSKNSQI